MRVHRNDKACHTIDNLLLLNASVADEPIV